MSYLNLASYQFVTLAEDSLPALKQHLKQQASAYGIKGTILLSTEGINLFIAGPSEAVNDFVDEMKQLPAFADLCFRSSESEYIPFKRLRVRIKKEIITMLQPAIRPEKFTAPYLEPAQLKQWYGQNQPMVVLDTRNTYEVNAGTFKQAIHLNIENFNEFPQAVATLPEDMKTLPIVTFCTGGIRCEKAAAYLLSQGFTDVWQLKGGILNYFEQCGSENFQGNCFVFDERVAVNAQLKPV